MEKKARLNRTLAGIAAIPVVWLVCWSCSFACCWYADKTSQPTSIDLLMGGLGLGMLGFMVPLLIVIFLVLRRKKIALIITVFLWMLLWLPLLYGGYLMIFAYAWSTW